MANAEYPMLNLKQSVGIYSAHAQRHSCLSGAWNSLPLEAKTVPSQPLSQKQEDPIYSQSHFGIGLGFFLAFLLSPPCNTYCYRFGFLVRKLSSSFIFYKCWANKQIKISVLCTCSEALFLQISPSPLHGES